MISTTLATRASTTGNSDTVTAAHTVETQTAASLPSSPVPRARTDPAIKGWPPGRLAGQGARALFIVLVGSAACMSETL